MFQGSTFLMTEQSLNKQTIMNGRKRTYYRTWTYYRTFTNIIERTWPLFVFVHLNNRTKSLFIFVFFIKRMNVNEIPAEQFTNNSLNVQFVYTQQGYFG
ncbi:hypothetical protein Hanom_Chr15g01384201 [Helianthus anomalus]